MGSLSRAVADLLTPRFLALSLLPVMVVVPLLALMLTSLGGSVSDLWHGGGTADGGWLADLFAALPLVGGLARLGWFATLLGIVGQVAGWLLGLLAALFLAVAFVGLLTPWIVAEVRRRHYPGVELRGSGGVAEFARFLLRTFVVFLGLLLLALPLMFIPGLNVLAINLPFFYWFHRLLSWDVAASIAGEAQAQTVLGSVRHGVMLRTLVLYPLSLVPLLGLCLQVLFVLVLTHYLLPRVALAEGRAQ